jgi:hypothetical protein
MLLVLGIANGVQIIDVSRPPAAILRWASPAFFEAQRVFCLGIGRRETLESMYRLPSSHRANRLQAMPVA